MYTPIPDGSSGDFAAVVHEVVVLRANAEEVGDASMGCKAIVSIGCGRTGTQFLLVLRHRGGKRVMR